MAPEWKIAGETFLAEEWLLFPCWSNVARLNVCMFLASDIKIAALDATTASGLAGKYGVSGYPTIKFFAKGTTTPVDYDGGRTADAIIQ